MFLRTATEKYMKNYLEQIKIIKEKIEDADAVIIGAGAGLSTSAGYIYNGENFKKYFSDFEEKYGFHDMYSGGFYNYETPEEMWAFWSRNIYVNRYMPIPKDTYSNLLKLVDNKDYFVITTNVDHCFQRAGFDKQRLFYTQGDYGLFQCSTPCHNKTYDNKDIVVDMIEHQKDMKIPSELIPKCPLCGKMMSMNLRSDFTFVEDEGWHEASERYAEFLRNHKDMKIVFLELGVGYNTPSIIKIPFWQMVNDNENSTLVCINKDNAQVAEEIEDKSICISDDIDKVIKDLL